MDEKLRTFPVFQRYLALDVLRGLTIALMVVVNTAGDWSNIYAPFEHSAWHGFTLTDLVFPTFLFVVGNAMSFSMKKLNKISSSAFITKVLKRTFIIFFIGVFLNGFPFVTYNEGHIVLKNLAEIRIWGVLQRIAICYALASFMIYFLNKRWVLIFSGLILLSYWGILYYFGNTQAPYSLDGNFAKQIDLYLLPAKNLYHGFGIPFDPEGFLSTFPAIVNVIAGYFAGQFIQKNGNNNNTVIKLVFSAALFLIIALVWDVYFPINKPIWTSSYVLFSIGWDLLLIGILIWIVEVYNFKKWTYFFVVLGKNPLFLYACSGVLIQLFYLIHINGMHLKAIIYNGIFTPFFSDKNASLLFAVFYMLIIWLIGYVLDKRKCYIKV